MNKLFLTLCCGLLLTQAYAQKIEIAVQANSGLFHYSGNGSTSRSSLNPGPDNQLHADNPYGNQNGFSYGADMQMQYVSKSGFITGLQAGYEILRSKMDADFTMYYLFGASGNYNIAGPAQAAPDASGKAFLQNQDININPYIGYRLHTKGTKIDLMPGIDIAYNISSNYNGSVTATDGSSVRKIDYQLPKAPADVRLRFGVAASWSKFGFTASYSHGVTNYTSNQDFLGAAATNTSVKSELIRLGISYRIF